MTRGLFSKSTPIFMLLMLVFTILASFLFLSSIGILLMPLIFNTPMENLPSLSQGYVDENNISQMTYIQVIFTISAFVIPAFMAAYLFSNIKVFDYFKLRHKVSILWFVATLIVVLSISPFINMLVTLNEMIVFPESLAGIEKWMRNFENEAKQTTEFFLSSNALWLNILMIAVLPAIGEELIFRGLLHNIFVRWTGNVHIAIIITGLLFSAMHVQFYGFFPRWLLGIIFSYLFVWSGTLWLSIFAHFINNAAVVIVYHLTYKDIIPDVVETYGTNRSDIPITLFATSIFLILLWLMWRKRIQISNPQTDDSCVSNHFLQSNPPAYPVSEPLEPTTR
jgi:membrane protease YdiL (CAAX protease family)